MRKLVLGLVGAAALTFGAGAANATVTVDGGTTVSWSGPLNINSGTFATFGYNDTSTGTPFTEWLNFSNTLSGTYSITLSSITNTLATNIDFYNFNNNCPSCGIWLSGGSIVGALQLVPDIDNVRFNEDYSLDTGVLGAGSYQIKFVGYGTGSFGGAATFTAVPEPATWAMMLLGFGVVGFAMRRRRRPALMQVA